MEQTKEQQMRRAREMKDIKFLYCEKCKAKTEHLKTGYRKIFENQWWRCLTCHTERED